MTSRIPKEEIAQIRYFHECFEYSPDTGILIWKTRPESHFSTLGGMRNANTRMPGNIAGSVNHGYLRARVDGVAYSVHRIAFALFHGRWPEVVDHIDGNSLNNRINNLRDVTQRDNARNMARQRSATTLLPGVFWHKAQCRWHAYIGSSGSLERLGSHACLFEAACARKSAEIKHGFHVNHGREPTMQRGKEAA